jgi:glutamine amidotransferase
MCAGRNLMCRHVAYLGPAVGLAPFLFDAPHGLVEQAAAPELQISTPNNPDGWGVVWFATPDGVPQQYRTAVPIWDDVAFVPGHGDVTASAFVAAVRAASPGSRIDARNNAPFVHGGWTFSLNGFVANFRNGVGDELRAELPPRRAEALEGDSDSEVLLTMVLDRITNGEPPGAALAGVAASVYRRAGGRLNLLLADGEHAVATALGNSLFVRSRGGSTTIASEPLDQRAGWEAVREASLVTATAGSHDIRPLVPS